MNRKPIVTLVALAAVGLAALALTNQTFATFAIASTPAGDAAIARGKYLVLKQARFRRASCDC